MKKFALLLTAAFSMTLILDSCSVQKRYHRKGFTVNWNNASVNMKKNRKVVHSESIQEEIVVFDSKKIEKLTKKYHAPAKNDMVNNNTSHPSVIDLRLKSSEDKIRENKISNKASTIRELSKKDVRSTKKEAKKIIKVIKKEQKKQGSNTDTALLVILALFFPPLAVYLYEGSWTDRCTINLILSLLCGLPGIIHALVVVLEGR
jgi:uncharacterized membrane protein YqaE (UPF0057 family)